MPDYASSTLAGVLLQIHSDADQETLTHRDEDCPDAASSCTAHNTLRLVAALEAVLALADEWDAVDPDRPWAADLREAITTALTEEDADHG